MTLFAHDSNELIHYTARHACVLVFGFLTEKCLLFVASTRHVIGTESVEKRVCGDFERRRARKAAAERHRRRNCRFERRDIAAIVVERRQNTADVVRPFRLVALRGRRGGGAVENDNRVLLVDLRRCGDDSTTIAFYGSSNDDCNSIQSLSARANQNY